MDIITKSVADLTPTEYKACYRANYGDQGFMQGALWQARKGYLEGAVAIMLWDGPPDLIKSLKGWVLLTPCTLNGELATSAYAKKVCKYTAQFWVKRQHRKQGLAKMLMHEVKKVTPRPHVIPHDKASSELFSSFRVSVAAMDRSWIKSKPKVA